MLGFIDPKYSFWFEKSEIGDDYTNRKVMTWRGVHTLKTYGWFPFRGEALLSVVWWWWSCGLTIKIRFRPRWCRPKRLLSLLFHILMMRWQGRYQSVARPRSFLLFAESFSFEYQIRWKRFSVSSGYDLKVYLKMVVFVNDSLTTFWRFIQRLPKFASKNGQRLFLFIFFRKAREMVVCCKIVIAGVQAFPAITWLTGM